MNIEREDYNLELRQLIRDTLRATLEGDFSAHADFPYFYTRAFYDRFTEVDGLPLYPQEIPEVFLQWAGLDPGQRIRPEDILVLDLETTGLGRGQTLAFMIGLGYFEAGRYVVEQLFLPEPEAEASSFDRLIELLEQRTVLITFNGKTFDIPILESRLLYNHIWLDLRAKIHIDLLHLARRLWKNKIPSCALETIEFYILGYIREKELDIEGGLIPQTYFQFLISGEAELMRRVFVHNQFDILHTAALFALICDSVGYPPAQGFDHRIDYHALAKLYLSQKNPETARAILTDLLAQDHISGDIACELGLINKKEGDLEAAESCFALASSLDHPGGMLEHAKLLEKRREYPNALELAQKLLRWHLNRPLINERQVRELEKRVLRLQNKLERVSGR
ncbi:MAG: ribonuclease H-like domain-containing protein [Candidatus Cloacimonetes bacterium]|nr:ribonuclease H-like domain-containing protein [Candidatus Cloacimonadota bacterium]